MCNRLSSYTETIANYCINNLDLDQGLYTESYRSMSACVIDCIYSLRARYFAITVPVVERYAEIYMNADRFSSGDNLRELVENIVECGGCECFAQEILNNNQRIGRRLKSEVCYDLSKKLLSLGINTIEDFSGYSDEDGLEEAIRSVRGIGPAGSNYLFMLAGDENRCKPDVHIHRFLRDSSGCEFTDDECQIVFRNVVERLQNDYQNLTVRLLDGIVWKKYQAMGRRNNTR